MLSDHNTTPSASLKRCSKCGESKPATAEYFVRDKNRRDQLGLWCKACRHKQSAKYRERSPEKARAWRAANAQRVAELQRAYYAKNKERLAEYQRAWRAANGKWNHDWHAKNRERVIAKLQRRRARKRGAEGTHTGEDIRAQYKRQKGRCYYCEIKVGNNYHVDHVIPLSRGGSDGPENLVIACPSCNSSKRDKMPHEWPQGGRLL